MGMLYLSSRWCNIIVYTTACTCNLLGMAFLLRSSPLLEKLVICNPKSNKLTALIYLCVWTHSGTRICGRSATLLKSNP
ncbi:hypothetical protein BT93_E2279 [Corymbia citriodora subsp. variegata]|nr:hypothetical protein BT93_E2279 [Corymbia citriodora subsp. variegata]